ncbi:MAG: hypothetical protein CL469_00410 [Acidimicrobiaceae bacterium]|nr:hypothetical protein [Acidimicrobiaceae bacterium]
MKIIKRVAAVLALSLLVVSCGSEESEQSGEEWPDKIVFGFVPSQEQDQLQDDIKPMVDHLSQKLGIEVEGIVTTDFVGLGTAMGTGRADLGAFGPAGFVMAQKEFGNMSVMAQAIRYGAPTYHGQWMTNDSSICEPGTLKSGTALINGSDGMEQVGAVDAIALQVGVYFGDSGKALGETVDAGSVSPGMSCMADISNVIGKTVAFTNESSTSGYQYPTLQLRNAGIEDDQYEKVFAGGHDGSVAAVYNGDADFGVAYDDARRSLRKTNTDVGDKVIIFNLTSEIPNDVIAVRTDLPDSLKGAIYYNMDAYLKTEEGEAVSDEVFGWTDMQVAKDSDFDVVREANEKLGVND